MHLHHAFHQVFHLEVIIGSVVFGLVALTVIFALVRSGTRWGRKASQSSSHPKTEMVYVSVVAGVAAFLIVLSLTANRSPSTPRPSLQVEATGFQWCWRFSYEGTPVSVTADCVNGVIPTLVVPSNRLVGFDVRSVDVVHSMWIPELRFKLAAFPAHVNSFTTTFRHEGTFAGRCAEFCGLYHYAMDFNVRVVPPDRFTAWLHTEEAKRR